MNRFHLANACVVTPDGLLCDVTVSVEDALITAIGPGVPYGDGDIIDVGGDLLVPGFVDTQVNGGADALFNDDPSVETIARIGEAHRAFGTTAFLPTLISDDLDVIDRAMRATEQAIEAGVPGVVGIHIEGPFINSARKGIHNADKIRRLTEHGVALLSGLKSGVTLVTLAPEMCSIDMIEALVKAGVVIAGGHTDATYATMRQALDAGVSGFTHLFNAMSPLRHRAPGVVGAALEDRDSYCGIIVDGHHVDPVALRLALRCKPVDRFMLVTDAMPSVGSSHTSFMLDGQSIVVKDGVCQSADGTLAGSNLDMASAFRNAVAMLGVSTVDAATMAATAPAHFLGLGARHGAIAVGRPANMVCLDAQFAVREVWQDSIAVHDRFARKTLAPVR